MRFQTLLLFFVTTSLPCVLKARGAGQGLLSLEQRLADDQVRQWGFTSGLQIFSISSDNETVHSAFHNPQHKSLAVAMLGKEKPQRRIQREPFISNSDLEPELASVLGLTALNQGASILELATGRRLFPFKLRSIVDLESRQGPYIVWNVSSGEVFIDAMVLQRTYKHFMGRDSGLLGRFAKVLTHEFGAVALGQRNETDPDRHGSRWSLLITRAAPPALAIALASQIPVWFCIACPVVLGLLAPFLFNFGFGTAAEMVCEHYQLPTEECTDLWYGAFALAMVLSLASAIPIVYICQLPKCGRQGLQ